MSADDAGTPGAAMFDALGSASELPPDDLAADHDPEWDDEEATPSRAPRYAVYDPRLLRFHGGVYDTAREAEAATDRGHRGIVVEV